MYNKHENIFLDKRLVIKLKTFTEQSMLLIHASLRVNNVLIRRTNNSCSPNCFSCVFNL